MGLREMSRRFFTGRTQGVGSVEGADPLAFLQRIPSRVPINQVVPRHEATVAGFVLALQESAEEEPGRLTALLQDESGTLEVVWQGRREVPGVEVGIALVVTGTVLVAKRVLRIIDPAYTILEEGTP